MAYQRSYSLNALSSLTDDIAGMKSKAVEFVTAQSALISAEPDPSNTALHDQWASLKNYGDDVRASVSWITSTIDTAGNVIDSVEYGVTHPFGYDLFGSDTPASPAVNGLGFLPLVPVVGVAVTATVISGAVAAMAYFIDHAYEFNKLVNADPATQANIIASQKAEASGGIAAGLSSVKWILIIGAVIYFAPKIMKMIEEGKKHG